MRGGILPSPTNCHTLWRHLPTRPNLSQFSRERTPPAQLPLECHSVVETDSPTSHLAGGKVPDPLWDGGGADHRGGAVRAVAADGAADDAARLGSRRRAGGPRGAAARAG